MTRSAHTPPPRDASERSPFVGRLAELRSLSDSWVRARSGERQVVLLSGEPGIGKTRLAAELADQVRAADGAVLIGRCDEDALIVYQPFIEALRGHFAQSPRDFSAGESSALVSDLARLLPELNTRKRLLETRSEGDPEAERYRLFEAVTSFLAAVSYERPTLVILDDLQWADRASLLLLKHIIRSPRTARLLLVGTYRDTDLRRGNPLANLLADLRRERAFHRIALAGLAAHELADLVEAWVGTKPAAGFVTALSMETEGNPFFVEEVLEHLLETPAAADVLPWTQETVAGDFGIPDGLREVIGRRLSRLAPTTNQLLTAASVLGQEFELSVVQQLADLSDESVLNALDEALRSRLILEQAPRHQPRYSFSHSLVRQTLYEELNLPRRQRLHMRAAQAIELIHAQQHTTERIAALATHYRNAGAVADPEKAIGYSVRAAEAATAVFAWEEAVAHYEGVLQALELVPAEQARRCDFLLALGWTLMPPGETQRVIESVAPEALAIAEGIGDASRAAAACRLAMEAFHRAGARMQTLTPRWQRWAEAYERYARAGSIDRVRLDLDCAEAFHMSGREYEAWSRRVAAFQLAKALNAPDELLLAAGFTMYYTQSPQREAQRYAIAREAAAWSTEGASARTLAIFYLYSAWAFWDWGEREPALAALDRLKQLPTSFRDPWVMEYAIFADGAAAALQGRLEDAVALAHEIVRLSDEIGSPVFGRLNAGNIAFRALLHLGRPEEALEILDWGWRAAGLGQEPAVNAPRRALALAAVGREPEAATTLAHLVVEREIGADDDGNVATTDLIPLLETAALLRDAERAAILYRRLEGVPLLVKVHGGTQAAVGRALGDAALLLGRPAAARAHYEAALAVCERIGFRPETAILHLVLAELLVKHYPHEAARAASHLDRALGELSAMGMKPWVERATRLRGQRRAARYPDGLTEREVEVLRLLAQGKSNQQIAADLDISLHTAGHHVGNILAKTSAANRTEAASYAFQRGLATSNG